jgi:arsenate reductase (thioredoxin)
MNTGSVTTRRRAAGLCLVFTVALGLAGVRPVQSQTPAVKPTQVLFMCPHGAAKSVLASAYFTQLAKERGLRVRVDAVGTDPDPTVAANVREHLARQGYVLPISTPRRVTATDLADADIVISLGCDVGKLPGPTHGALRQWDEIPGPGEHLTEADAAIRARVVALIEELASRVE